MEDRGRAAAVSIEYSYYFIVAYCRVRSEARAARGGRAEQPGERVPLDGAAAAGQLRLLQILLRRLPHQQVTLHSLHSTFSYLCSGWVVTAAHCIYPGLSASSLQIRLGEHDRYGPISHRLNIGT